MTEGAPRAPRAAERDTLPTHPLVVAVDCSTSAAKAVVVDRDGGVRASGRHSIPLRTPAMDRYEQNPDDWWAATRAAIDAAVGSMPQRDRRRVAALCLTHQRETFALLDEHGRPVRPAILWLDSRAGEQIRRLGTARVHELSGKQPDTTPALYKIAWVHEHEPKFFARAARLVDVHAFLAHRLTGRWVSSTASADSLGLFDIRRQTWAPGLLRLAGLRADQMPGLARPGQPIAHVRAALLRRWGLPASVPLIAGLGDGQAAGLGAAAIRPGIAYLNVGTSIVCGVHAAHCAVGDAYRTLVSGMPGHYVLECVQNSGSVLLNWFRERFGDPRRGAAVDPELEEQASHVPPGCDGLLTLPYWNAVQTPYWDPFARGAVVGFGSAHTRAHAYRSLIEGMAFELRSNLEKTARDLGRPVTQLRAVGGGSRSELVRSILADATGLPLVRCATAEVSAQGAAVLAMAAIGAHRSVGSAAEAMCHLGARTDPDPARTRDYRRWHAIQRDLYPALRAIFEHIHREAGRTAQRSASPSSPA